MAHTSFNGAHPSRNTFAEPPSLMGRLLSLLPSSVDPRLLHYKAVASNSATSATKRTSRLQRGSILRRILNIPSALICLWIFSIWWGEHLVYKHSLESCSWKLWEQWPSEAVPHRLVLIADPQLVDPHTYPGRPWPLSSLTVYYTDLYIRRSYSLLQKILYPDTIFFLGDLFDGGREWGTGLTRSSDDRYKPYGNNYWLKEYDRFGEIFFSHWNDGGSHANHGQAGRKIIAELPGNHDLGLGNLIQGPVRKRFNTYFGDGSRVDVVGNHSIVSVDTVSLTAMDQVDPKTGSQGTGAGDGDKANAEIWAPVELFLDEVKAQKARAADREIRFLNGKVENILHKHAVRDLEETVGLDKTHQLQTTYFPTILLTHIPLFRKPGTPCGPLRERWPPSYPERPTEKDDRNAIPYSAGYQYQNVLTPTVSRDLIEKIGDVVQVYSGDDHDYCELDHPEYSGKIKEITVKSISWAMGVRKPGFQMSSLWNPIDEKGNSMPSTGSSSASTIQNHLCLLPDQLGIFIRYAFLLIFSLIILFVRAIVVAINTDPSYPDDFNSEPLIPTSVPNFLNPNPTSFPSSAEQEKSKSLSRSSSRPAPSRYYRPTRTRTPSPLHSHESSTSITSASEARLAPRSTTAASRTPRGASPANHNQSQNHSSYAIPIPQAYGSEDNFGPAKHAFVVEKEDDSGGGDWDEWGMPRKRARGLVAKVIGEFVRSTGVVGIVAATWYMWMLWHE